MYTPEINERLRIIAQRAFTHPESVRASYALACDVIERGIPGDLVECGVYAGAQCAAMALALMEYRLEGTEESLCDRAMKTRVHLFDSFEGISQPGEQDIEFVAHKTPKGDAACSLEDVRKHMAEWGIPSELLVYHTGWITDGYLQGKSDPATIALLRMDCDLYEPTAAIMKHLYPRVSMGGWVICDDYELSGCQKAVHEVVCPKPAYWQRLS